MSRPDKNSKIKKYQMTSTESINKREIQPTKTSQSLNTESFEYFNQITSSKNNITESPYNTMNQQSNSRYSSNNQTSNSKLRTQTRALEGKMQSVQGNTNLSGLKCTCNKNNENFQKNIQKCNCSQKNQKFCTCGQFKKQLFEEEKSGNKVGNANFGFQSNSQQKFVSQSRYVSSNNNEIQNYQKSRTYQSGGGALGPVGQSQTIISNRKVITYVSPNNPSLQISEEKNKNLSSTEKGKRIDSNVNTYSKEIHTNSSQGENFVDNYAYLNSNQKHSQNFNNETYQYNKKVNINITNTNTNTNINNTNTNRSYSYSYDNRIRDRTNRILNIEWSQKCVGQNNENLQILASEKPQLIAQCVQDMQVIQEPRPVQILLPMQPNEIDYTLGLEIYGKNKEEEKRALKEAERLRKQMEICPLKNEELNISKAYSTIEPHFENLNIDRKEELFCQGVIIPEEERQNKFKDEKDIKAINDRRALSVKNGAWDLISIEKHEMNIYGEEKNFNRFNQKVLTTKMNVRGYYKPKWNDLNRAIKTTKMNIEGTAVSEPEPEEEGEKEEEEKAEENLEEKEEIKIEEKENIKLQEIKKTEKKPKKKPAKKKVKKPVKKKPVKKVIKKLKKVAKKHTTTKEELLDEPSESETQEPELEIDNNYELNIPETEMEKKFGALKVQNKVYNYKAPEKPKEEEKPEKLKYEKDETLQDSNDIVSYEAEYPKNIDWNEDTIPMSGRPFTIEKKPKPTLFTSKAEKISIKESYKSKDWNKNIRERNEIKLNMLTRKSRRHILSKHRVQPVILKGKESNWNKIVKRENDTKLQIDKSPKKANFVLTKDIEFQIENEAEEILVNDDYNIVEENYSRPIRANIRKVEDLTEESVSSDYDILKNIHRHESQFNQFKEMVSESLKIFGQKVIINDVSGKYPRRVETFHGLDENFEKYANDQINQRKRFKRTVKYEESKQITRTVEKSGFTKKEGGEGGISVYSQKEIVQTQTGNEPLQQKSYFFKAKIGSGSESQQERKITYEPEHENENELINVEKKMIYNKEISSSEKRYHQENEQAQEQEIEQEIGNEQEEEGDREIEQDQEQPEDKDQEQNDQNKIKYVYKNQIDSDENQVKKISGNHIEYVYEKTNSQMQQENENEQENEHENEQENEQENEHENEHEEQNQQIQNQIQNQNITNVNTLQEQRQIIVKEEMHQQPDGQIRQVKYVYKEEKQPGMVTQSETHIETQKNIQNIQNIQIESKKEENKSQVESQINEEERQSQSQGNKISIEKEASITQSPKSKGSLNIEKKSISQKEQEHGQIDQSENKEEHQEKHRLYIKEITYNKNENDLSPEDHKARLRYIALKRREDQEETDSQPRDEVPEDEQPKEEEHQHEEQNINSISQEKMESQSPHNEIKSSSIENSDEKEKKSGNDVQENFQKEENLRKAGKFDFHGNAEIQKEENEEEQQDEEVEDNQEEQYEDEEGQEEENEQMEGEDEEQEQENEAENERNSQQNINQAQMLNLQRNAQNPPHITSATGVQIQNSNLNQANAVNSQTQIRTQFVQTNINNGNFRQVNIQKQQQIIRQGVGAPSSDVVYPDPQYNANIVRNAQISQNISSSIKNEKDAQNRDPMMYSFGAKSAASPGPNLANSANKNVAGSENEFLQSSLTNQNNMIANQQSGLGMGNSRIITGSNIVTSSRITAEFAEQSQVQTSGNRVFSSPNQMAGSQREVKEPGDSKKKPVEEEEDKKEDIDDIPLEPRDSRRKN